MYWTLWRRIGDEEVMGTLTVEQGEVIVRFVLGLGFIFTVLYGGYQTYKDIRDRK